MRWLLNIWRTLNKPTQYLTLGSVSVSAFIMGIIFWGGFNTALQATNTEEFCISCHSMESMPYKELQETVHWSNHSGVRATCPDCHVPHDWSRKIGRKIEASHDMWGWLLQTVNTPEKFEDKRLEMASREWKRFDRDNSLACKNCHNYDSMKWDSMSKLAQKQMKRAAKLDQSCVDCHKGIAHKLPDMGTARAPELIAEVGSGVNGLEVNKTYFSALTKPVYFNEKTDVEAGTLNIATKVKVLELKGNRAKIGINGWRKKIGAGRVIYYDFGLNILSAQLTKDAALEEGVITTFEEKEDPMTGLKWQRVETVIWTDTDYLLSDLQPLWDYARSTYSTSCSVCHTQPDESHFDANTWPGMFQGMIAFVNMDQDTQALVQKYLQEHSSTFNKSAH
ncbi:pentaheme c-type cytochrome TorC [Shewanella sp. Choline-02u-19]|uniref:pentaheme c-type cytochrome TorC n=1 Tax=unclassified Shewanella TaxID=196818 RepID=UPI000C344753|nr:MULTISPECIES: pentaheme c-type cytochrome TorC [unclassified Shewanella]PKG58544.1 pentaheme c-type cytochrome TorC [Shewanella sp. GutDb-MelDb]PKG75979.1 pentaheme c-type cytochrome TorC [Shewanella sp. GutCb]PKH56740.1 pentaheme c-type cytochrome TorC [Shewanella sp. Bg11-22]PKI30291.1 pentaheme c-type cytochrome TorC [Shewanella sp. Choline-02u-19]